MSKLSRRKIYSLCRTNMAFLAIIQLVFLLFRRTSYLPCWCVYFRYWRHTIRRKLHCDDWLKQKTGSRLFRTGDETAKSPIFLLQVVAGCCRPMQVERRDGTELVEFSSVQFSSVASRRSTCGGLKTYRQVPVQYWLHVFLQYILTEASSVVGFIA